MVLEIILKVVRDIIDQKQHRWPVSSSHRDSEALELRAHWLVL